MKRSTFFKSLLGIAVAAVGVDRLCKKPGKWDELLASSEEFTATLDPPLPYELPFYPDSPFTISSNEYEMTQEEYNKGLLKIYFKLRERIDEAAIKRLI